MTALVRGVPQTAAEEAGGFAPERPSGGRLLTL
jgi:hypothetical protein